MKYSVLKSFAKLSHDIVATWYFTVKWNMSWSFEVLSKTQCLASLAVEKITAHFAAPLTFTLLFSKAFLLNRNVLKQVLSVRKNISRYKNPFVRNILFASTLKLFEEKQKKAFYVYDPSKINFSNKSFATVPKNEFSFAAQEVIIKVLLIILFINLTANSSTQLARKAVGAIKMKRKIISIKNNKRNAN